MRQKSDEDARRRLGEAIKRLRKDKGLTRRELEERTGISYPFLSEIEGGKKSPRPDNLQLIADALETEVSSLWALAEEGYQPRDWVAPRRSYFRSESMASPGAALPPPADMNVDASEGPRLRARHSNLSLRGEDKRELLEIVEELGPSDLELLMRFARRLRG